MNLFQKLKQRAKADPKRIVLPESFDDRVLYASAIILKERIAKITLLGEKNTIFSRVKKLGLKNFEEAEIIDHTKDKHFRMLATAYYNLRKHKGITLEQAEKELKNPIYFAALMVREDLADGFVGGASITSREVAKAAIQGVGVDKNIQTASSSFLIVVPRCNFGEKGVFMFADCGIVPNPSAKQVANIAISTASLFRQLVGAEPKVAMLSYSSHGSGTGESVEKMREAVDLVKQMFPDLIIDGELQVDAAIVPQVAKIKVPSSKLAGYANVLIFPNLAAGNISYKLVQRLAGARAIGPILQGLIKPCSDLSRGCNIQDIVDAIMINVVRAQWCQ
jgi:phosphate acetyltransferase